MTTKIKCDEFERILEQQDEAALPQPALAHMEDCESCRFLAADLSAIRDAALELGAEELPVPERVWISLRNQIDAEEIQNAQRPVAASLKPGWWAAFQRPALAGAFLSLILAAAALVGYQSGSAPMAVHSPLAPLSDSAPILSAEKEFKEESQAFGNALLPELRQQNAAVTDSFRRNLSVVDHFIAMCENSVREQPDNEMAREYLYGAYEQKAELLATAMNRNVTGGLQ
ncbi:MAG: hypothetical protein LAO08_15210 [Acidobacteriia bacterium]|nr:hypothetical protein [Terriglobia bacterium]